MLVVVALVLVVAVVAGGWGHRAWVASGLRADFQVAAGEAWVAASALSDAVEDAEWLRQQAAGEVADPRTLDGLADALGSAEQVPAMPLWQGWQDWPLDRLERVTDELNAVAVLMRDAEDALLRAAEQVHDSREAWRAAPGRLGFAEDSEGQADPALGAAVEESSW